MCTHESLTPLLAFQLDRVNTHGEPFMTDLLASHFGAIKQDIRNIKKQLKPAPSPNVLIRKLVTPWTNALSECQTLTNDLKTEILTLKNHQPLPATPHLSKDDISRAVLRIITTLLPKQDTSDDTAITYEDLMVTVAMNLTNHIKNIINTAIDNFQTHQTNELALKNISTASVALTRSIQLKNIEADHKTLQEQHKFLN